MTEGSSPLSWPSRVTHSSLDTSNSFALDLDKDGAGFVSVEIKSSNAVKIVGSLCLSLIAKINAGAFHCMKATLFSFSIKISFINLPENVTPTIQGRDFVIATVAAPTVVKEPEKPAEAEGEGGDAAEAAADGDAKPEEGAEKAADGDKGKEEGKAPAEKK